MEPDPAEEFRNEGDRDVDAVDGRVPPVDPEVDTPHVSVR